jgi:hypothetical protein
MTEKELFSLKFPIGKFSKPEVITPRYLSTWINDIQSFPHNVDHIVTGLSLEELHWKYRPEGWNIQQLVHHCADSHMNALIRFKLALTEDVPTIKPYEEALWAELPDSLEIDIKKSLKILEGVHARLGILLKSLSPEQLKREFIHPDHENRISLAENIGMYAWHSNHHLAHMKHAIDSHGKYND